MKKNVLFFTAVLLFQLLSSCVSTPLEAQEAPIKSQAVYNAENVMLAVIDVQEMYIGWAVTPNLDQILNNIDTTMETANDNSIPMVVTYELGEQHERAMNQKRTDLATDAGAMRIIKTRFDATSHGLWHFWFYENPQVTTFIVVGAETDVCVMETVLGLLEKGKKVLLVDDAVYTSEANDGVARKRMAMAGAQFITTEELVRQIEANQVLQGTTRSDLPVLEWMPRMKKGKTATVLMNYDAQAIENTVDPYKDEKIARLHHSSYYLHVMSNPLFMVNNPGVEGVAPEGYGDLSWGKNINIGTDYNFPAELVAELKAAGIQQITLGGVDVNGSLILLAHGLKQAGFDVFLVEDMLLSQTVGIEDTIKSLHWSGMLPLTYKTYNYGYGRTADIMEYDEDVIERFFSIFGLIDAGIISWVEALPPIVK